MARTGDRNGAPSGASVPLNPDGTVAVSAAVFPVESVERTSTQTAAVRGVERFVHTTTGVMVDGFGAEIDVAVKDSVALYTAGGFRAKQFGGTNFGRFETMALVNGTLTAKAGVDRNGWTTPGPRPWIDVTDPNITGGGAKGDAKVVTDGAITTATNIFTSATAAFVATDVGKTIKVVGAGAAGADLLTTISGFTNATTVTLTANAGTTVAAATATFGTSDGGAIVNAIALLPATGGDVFFPPNCNFLIAGQLAVTNKTDVRFIFGRGARLTQVTTNANALSLSGAHRFQIKGGRLTGPGKATATSVAFGISLTNTTDFELIGTEVDNFYHALSGDTASTDKRIERPSFHDNAFCGFMHINTGDMVALGKFKNNGTTNLHHDIYGDFAIAGGVRLIGNNYEGTAGAAVHFFSTTLEQYGITAEGESFLNCYTSYLFGEFNQHNIDVSGAVAKGCTDRGMVLTGNIHDSSFQITIENSTGRNLDIGPGGVVATNPTDLLLFIVSKGGTMCFVTADYCEGTISAVGSSGDGVRLSAGSYNHLRIKARGNAGDGVRGSGATVRNVLDVQATGNTGYGVDLTPAGVDNNTITGQAFNNTAGQLNNAGAGNTVTGLRVA